MEIRKSTEQDIDRLMAIFAHARRFMAAHGNPNQWGPNCWPPEALIRRDIAQGNSYVCVHDGRVVGTFFYTFGRDVEPTYARITEGAWLDDSPYGVVHRIASDGTVKGVGAYCIRWAFDQCGHLRIDTHGDNRVMQRLLEKLGFTHCGTIYVEQDDDPRLAYELTASDARKRQKGNPGKERDPFMDRKESETISTGRIPGLQAPVSRLFFGTANPPVSTDDGAAFGLLDSALECGINAFDCARSYGRAENALGKWMQARGCRDSVTLLTKCGDITDGRVLVNRQVIAEQLARSLEALRTDRIDLYLLHRDDPNTPVEEFIDAMNEHRERGRIVAFGVSNWRHERIEAANRYAAAHGLAGFAASSPNYGLARQMRDLWGGGCVTISGPENAAARAWYEANQMPVIAYSSLGRGFFSGRFRAYDDEGARQVLDAFAQKGYLYPQNMERLRRAEVLAGKYGVSVPEIAMRYIFGSPMNVFAVVSTTSVQRMRMNLRAAATPLSPEDVSFLEAGDAE